MSTYVIVEELGDWPCHADYLLTARTYLQHGVPTTGGRPASSTSAAVWNT